LSREEKDIQRWKRDFPGKVLFHFSIPGKFTYWTNVHIIRPIMARGTKFKFLGENGLKEPKKSHKSDILIPIKKI
jgi:hypothetical protein